MVVHQPPHEPAEGVVDRQLDDNEYKRKHQKVIEGIMSIQSGGNLRIVEHKLSVIY